jgi:hypothetical protein
MFQDYCDTINLCEKYGKLSQKAQECLKAFMNPEKDEYTLVEEYYFPLSEEDKELVLDFLNSNNGGCNYRWKLIHAIEDMPRIGRVHA